MRPESTWTPPSEFCPHPERWHAPDAMSTETEASEAVAALVRVTQPDLVVELGSAWGHTTFMLGHAVRLNGHGRVVAVDLDPGAVQTAAWQCRGLPVDVVLADVYKWSPPEGIGFLFVDAGEPPDRVRMFTHLRPHLARGAVAVFHDAAPHHGLLPGLEALQAKGLIKRFVVLRNPRGLCVAEID
jgi:predicted O-methyltransferase YrrM